MKTKIISLLIAISIVISLFTVYSFASEAASDTDSGYTTSYLHYKHTYGDESDDIGGERKLNNSSKSTVEVRTEANGNHYGYYNFNDSTQNVFMEFNPNEEYNIGSDMLGYMIFELDFNDLGNSVTTSKFFEVNSGKGSFAPSGGRYPASDILNIANDSKGNYFYFLNDHTKKIYIESNTWTHIRCEMSVLSANASKYQFKCYINGEYFESSFTLGTPQIIYQIRLGSSKSTNQIFGLDNIKIYTTVDNSEYIGALYMKVGAENASLNGDQFELTSTPLLIDGEVFCPVYILESLTEKECSDKYIVSLENTEYIHLDDIEAAFGISAKTYSMGLIIIGNDISMLPDNASNTDIADLLKGFVFNIPDEKKIISDVESYTNGFSHPYLLVNSDRFAELRSIYKRGQSGTITDPEELVLYDYIVGYLASARSHLKNYCDTDEGGTYKGLLSSKIPVNNHYANYSNNGYDNGGRVSIDTNPLLYFAFAYQITEKLNYVRAAYDLMLAFGEWNHWGPDHFLNCADAAAPFAIAYDWLYNAFVQLNSKGEVSRFDNEKYDKSKIATILFTHVIIPGYVQSNNLTCPWPGTANSRYSQKTSNWNAVCTSGVIAAALMLLEEDVSTAGMTFNTQTKRGSTYTQTVTKIEEIGKASIHTGLSTYSDYAAKLASMNLGTLAQFGLDQYMPDGSYIESPSYWAYGTNTLFRMIAALLSATGDDYGFMDAWGIDTTCYFAVHSESSDYKTWNFNDGSVGMQDTSYFFFVGGYYEDDNLVRIRKKHLNEGKKYSLYDILYYDTTIVGEPQLATEYQMLGIDAFSVRSSWDKGAIYAGIIGGENNCSHGQMDAGSFIYHNQGKIWFTDLGADNYNIKYVNSDNQSKGYFSNFELYRVGAEGHNIIAITDEQSTLPYGQLTTANPKIVKSYSGSAGGYAVLDMSAAYGVHVESAQRGILFTNSRNTVVIQDEYVFNGAKTAYWFGHYQLATGYVEDVVISADGRTAFMISGDDIMRVSIVSDNSDLKFEIMDCYTYLLDKTLETDRSTMGGAATETSRDSYRKLAIKCENVTSLNLAVVIEEVDGYVIGSSYDYDKIDDWALNTVETPIIEEKFKADFDDSASNVGAYRLESSDGSYKVTGYNFDKYSYLGILPYGKGANSIDSKFTLYFQNNAALSLAGYRYLTFDMDIFTESTFVYGTTLGVNIKRADGTAEYVELLELRENTVLVNGKYVNIGDDFKHITLILDTEDGSMYVYQDNEYVTNIPSVADKSGDAILNFELTLPSSSANSVSSAILLGEMNVRTFSYEYDSTEIAELLGAASNLSGWEDRIVYDGYVSALATANGDSLYTNAQIESAINNGYDVNLLRDTTGLINVNSSVTVHTNGYSFDYVSSDYVANHNGTDIVFVSGTVTVKWHIGDEVFVDIYKGSDIASFKGSSNKVGKTSYTKTVKDDGTVIYSINTTGWSNTPGGLPVSGKDMVVSPNNCEFWLVDTVPVDCLFVTINSSGVLTEYYTASEFSNIISSNTGTYDVVLCRDVELANIVTLGKKGITLYLNGYTLSCSLYDKHMFTYSSASTADFSIIGPGNLVADGLRTILTSTASTSDKTSSYGVVFNGINIVTNVQLADVRVGQHKFINCNISHNRNDKNIMALWNKNSTVNNGVPANLLTVTFEGCVIISESVASYALFSYSSGTYSEVYIIDTTIISEASLIESTSSSVKLVVSGTSSVAANKLSVNSSVKYANILFDNGVATNLNLEAAYMPTNSVLTNNYDKSFPYLISGNYAKITWMTRENQKILDEFVAIGVTPKIPSAVKAYLDGNAPGYTYCLDPVASNTDIVLAPVEKQKSTVMLSMSIYENIAMYLYVAQSDVSGNLQSLTLDGVQIIDRSYELVQINGISYCKYVISNCTPSTACDKMEIVLQYTDGQTKTIIASVVSYLEDLLSVSDNDDEKILAVKLLKYIKSAYEYFNTSSILESKQISDIIDEHKKYDVIFGDCEETKASTDKIRNAVKSACFNISTSVRIRFYLNANYTGNLNLTFNGETDEYYVVNGFVNGLNYVDVSMPAHLINNRVIISDGVNSVEYGLSAYVTATNNYDSAVDDLLNCMSEYATAAKVYVAENS